MKKLLLIVIAILCTQISVSQGEAANWYFGYGAGMQFDQASGTINVVDNGMLSTNEGCASISDTTGNLLFYSDGSTVWNRNHTVMQNGDGLFGDASSTQSAIIVQKPNDDNIYYIFTVDNALDGNNFGLNYSEVDMTLDAGLGAVTQKNINLLPICSEKISAVIKDCLTGSIWVITFAAENGDVTTYNSFHAFEISDLGVNTASVVSTFNLLISDGRGYLKLSPDGTKLANANMSGGLYLYDFDVNTGIVSNEQPLIINTTSNRAYGVEFSPDNRFLYVHSSNDYFNQQDPSENNIPTNHWSTLTQFDVTVPDVQASELTLDERNLYRGGLQLAPDGKIYRALSATYSTGLPNLGVINNPNAQGAASNYLHNAINLFPNTSSQGLPPFLQSLFNQQIDIIQNGMSTTNLDLCTGDNYTLIADDILGATYTWTVDGNPLPETDFDLVVDQTGHYEVFIDQNNGDCAIEGQAFVSVYDIPIANQPNDMLICDDNNDGLWEFDFTIQDVDVLDTQSNTDFIVKYFETQLDADNNENEITGLYNNTSNPQTIYVRIESSGFSSCYDTTSFEIEVFNTPTANPVNGFISCDDGADGDDTNGQTITDFNLVDAIILNTQNAADYTITYHLSQLDADNGNDPLATNYYNTTAFLQTVYVRIENNLNSDCYDTTSFDIEVNPIPDAFDTSLFQCDEDGIADGFTLFNLTEANDVITGSNPDVTVQYYTDASHSNEIDGNSFSNYENPQTIYITVTDVNTGCFRTSELLLEVSATAANDALLEVCDEDGTEDGFASFNLLDADATVLNGLPTDVTLTYYETYEDALLEVNPLGTTFTNTIAYSQTIFARVENDNACYGINEVQLTVFQLPNIDTEEELIYCLNSFPETITLTGGVINDVPNNYYYNWSTGETTMEIEVNAPGTYTVTVTNTNGCSKIRTINVLPSNEATIESIDVVDATSNNTLTVNVSGEGDYEYSLNEEFGTYQDSNFFDNVPPGFHTVFVRDKKGCGTVAETVSVIGFPKFFTPNGDPHNETWHVYGINTPEQFQSKIYIFDRYGKLIIQLDPRGPGWDGNLNGKPLPTSDYWFYVVLQDGREFKSHFTLKR